MHWNIYLSIYLSINRELIMEDKYFPNKLCTFWKFCYLLLKIYIWLHVINNFLIIICFSRALNENKMKLKS